jgi:hypothetical protein
MITEEMAPVTCSADVYCRGLSSSVLIHTPECDLMIMKEMAG